MFGLWVDLLNCAIVPLFEAWHLVASIAKQIFINLALVRSSAKFIHVSSADTERVATVLMWSTLQSHRIMQEYLLAGFRGHPNVAPVVTLHLYEHRVPTTVFAKLEKEVETIALLAKSAKSVQDRNNRELKQGKG